MDSLPVDKRVTILPMKSFPVIKDLVTDVSWNFRVNKKIPPFQPRPSAEWKIDQRDVDRVQEFRKCIECFLCQDVCLVLREHDKNTTRRTVRRTALFCARGGSGDAPHGRRIARWAAPQGIGHRPLQHHEMLHRSPQDPWCEVGARLRRKEVPCRSI
jgi:succinate dehydrogenase/fumarate reductase-like Fe-S protein